MDTAAVPKPAEVSNNVKFATYDVINTCNVDFSYMAGSRPELPRVKTVGKKKTQNTKRIKKNSTLSTYTFSQWYSSVHHLALKSVLLTSLKDHAFGLNSK